MSYNSCIKGPKDFYAEVILAVVSNNNVCL